MHDNYGFKYRGVLTTLKILKNNYILNLKQTFLHFKIITHPQVNFEYLYSAIKITEAILNNVHLLSICIIILMYFLTSLLLDQF